MSLTSNTSWLAGRTTGGSAAAVRRAFTPPPAITGCGVRPASSAAAPGPTHCASTTPPRRTAPPATRPSAQPAAIQGDDGARAAQEASRRLATPAGKPSSRAPVAELRCSGGARRDVLVEVEHVGGVVFVLEGLQAGELVAAVGVPHPVLSLSGEEVDVRAPGEGGLEVGVEPLRPVDVGVIALGFV